MTFKRFVGASVVVAAGLAGSAFANDGKPEPLVITGESTVIVGYGESYAVSWLQYYMIKCVAKHPDAMAYSCYAKQKIDRAAAPVFPILKTVPENKNALVIGTVKHLPAEFLSDSDKVRLTRKPGCILVRRQGNTVLMAKNTTDPWNLNHIRVFLDKAAGVRLYAPGNPGQNEEELWLSMPAGNELTIDDLDIFMKPFFAKTTFSSGGYRRNVEWLRMNTMVSEGLDLRASHTIIKYFPPEKYYKEHPELYPMGKNGQRPQPIGDAWNPCLADPDLAAKIAMQEVRELQKNPRARGYLSFGVMDCHYDCHCPVCATSLKEHAGNAANLWYTFLNQVAKQCQQEFPGLYLTSYYYSNIGRPSGMRIESNIAIDNVIKSYQFTNPTHYRQQREEILEMAGLGASWVTHDWNFSGVTPRIYSRQLAGFLQWGAQNGMLGMYTEWSGQEYWYLDGAKYWVLRQLLSDPYQDVDALWRQYCQDMFGAAWEEMYRFYDMFAVKHVLSDKYYSRADWPRMEAAGFMPADLAQQRRWLEHAVELTRTDPLIQKRLAAVLRYFRAHELLALAVGVPARAHHRYSVLGGNTGINDEALAFYVNDDGRGLVAFDRYYEAERTIAPDSNAEDKNSSLRFSGSISSPYRPLRP